MPAPLELEQDLSHLNANLVEELDKDLHGARKYVTHTMITYEGGPDKLYKVNTIKGSYYTVSCRTTGEKCLHYVLTDEGLSHVQELAVIAAL
jgi:hypothetical protein